MKEYNSEIRGSHDSEDVSVGFVLCHVIWSSRWLPVFQKNIPTTVDKRVIA
jgi:hypothetical protein